VLAFLQQEDDEYVVHVFNKVLRFNIIKGSVCLFHWMKVIGENMYEIIDLDSVLDDLDEMETLSEKREYLHQVMSEVFDALEPQLNLDKMKCEGNKCDNSYDGEDLFTFSVQFIEDDSH